MNQKPQFRNPAVRKLNIMTAGIMLVAAMINAPASAIASTFRVPHMSELTDLSSAVVRGTVTSSDCRRLTGSGRIVTDYSVEVLEIIADSTDNNIGRTVHITFPGGAIGNDGEMVAGVPSYTAGDEVILFLKRPGVTSAPHTDRDFFLVTGMAVGAFRVDRTVVDKPVVHGYLHREANGARVRRSSAASLRSSGTAEPDSISLQDLIETVRSSTAKSSDFKGEK